MGPYGSKPAAMCPTVTARGMERKKCGWRPAPRRPPNETPHKSRDMLSHSAPLGLGTGDAPVVTPGGRIVADDGIRQSARIYSTTMGRK
jgi:hypothetical protein